MADHFEFLTRARPASVYKLLQKLPIDEAATVLSGLPQTVVVQILAYFPDESQAAMLPAMREARQLPPERKEEMAEKIKTIIRAAKTARQTETGIARPDPVEAAAPPEQPPREAPQRPIPIVRPPTPPSREALPPPSRTATGGNPYQSAPSPKLPHSDAPGAESGESPSSLTNLGSRLKDALKAGLENFSHSKTDAAAPSGPPPPRRTSSLPPRRREPPSEPKPWIPRAATSSPINGPALPGKPPPITGDPLESPLARAGLLDLIGNAQERLLPKPGARKAARPPQLPNRPAARGTVPGKRPEPREGMARPGEVSIGNTPRVIGPRPKAESAPESGARRMDGKAILAAILREAGPEVRNQVKGGDPQLFKQLRGRMFYFDDLNFSDDNALARVFTTAPAAEAGLALQFAAPALRDRVLRAVSPGRARALLDTPKRPGLDAVEAAQEKVLEVALQLQAAGRILIDPRDPDLAGM